jgi:hypothetical protein
MAELIIQLSRVDRVYRPGERVAGTVTVRGAGAGAVAHSGLSLRATGSVRPLDSRAAAGAAEAARPIVLADVSIDMAGAGRLPPDVALPFEFILEALPGRTLTETCASFCAARGRGGLWGINAAATRSNAHPPPLPSQTTASM